jgi:hypothetical protein
MIEPQNTVFPVAAESRPAEPPQGEEAGFGAMLAQSLGLTSQLDPGAVQQIISGHYQQGETADDGMTEDNLADDADRRSANVVPSVSGTNATQLPLGASVAASRSGEVGRFRLADAVPGTGDSSVPLPTADQPGSVEVSTAAANERLLIAPSVQIAGDDAEVPDPVNGVLQTLLTGEATSVPPAINRGGRETVAAEASGPGEPIGLPVVGDVGDDGIAVPLTQRHVADPAPRPGASGKGIDPVAQPLPGSAPAIPVTPEMQTAPAQQHQIPQPELAEPPSSVNPAQGDAKSVADRPVARGSAPAETTEPTVVAEIAKGSATVATPAASVEPRIDLAPEIPVQMDTPSRGVAVAAADVSTVAPASLAEPQAAHTSALAERVLQAVDLQRTQPPPRSMVVDIPEIEGLRLVVSVRSGGQVSVTQAGGANAEAFTPFAEDLSRVLSQRGFVMNGDDRRNGHNPHTDEERAPFRAPRSNFRRPVRQRQDNDLRI